MLSKEEIRIHMERHENSLIPKVRDWLRSYIKEPSKLVLEEKDKNFIQLKDKEIVVKAALIRKYWKTYDSGIAYPTGYISTSLAVMAGRGTAKTVAVPGGTTKMWGISIDRLLLEPEDMREALRLSRYVPPPRKDEESLPHSLDKLEYYLSGMYESLSNADVEPSMKAKIQEKWSAIKDLIVKIERKVT